MVFQKNFKGCLLEVLKVFQGFFKELFRVFQGRSRGCSERPLRLIQVRFKGI